jgi:thioredoxin-related protein
MKTLAAIIFLQVFSLTLFAQNGNDKIYNPDANAKAEIAAAVLQADSTEKNVLLQIGGNWCPWCLKFNKFCKADTDIDTLMHNNFVVLHVNYSKENKNLEVMKSLGFPQRFGFPVFVILDGKGNRLHTQDSGLLELGDSYNRDKIITFLTNWTPIALKPENYEK